MGDAGRYRKLYPRLWRHPGFAELKQTARELTLYLLTGPQTNRIGLFTFSVGLASEDLNVGRETLLERLTDVRRTFGWHFDADARVMFIPSWWRFNAPENPNVLRGNLRDLSEIPRCALVDAFAANLETLPETLHPTFVECCRQRLAERSPIQEQEQDQKQKQKQDAGAGRAARAAETDERHVSIATEALSHADDHSEMETLVDSVQWIGRTKGMEIPKASAVAALNAALAQQRSRRRAS